MGQRVGKPGITYSLVGGRTVEWIKSGKMPDKVFGVIRNRVPVQALEFDFGIGEGGGVVRTKGEVTAGVYVGDDG